MAELLRKTANARLQGAEGRGVDVVVTEALTRLTGGTWVGGTIVLTDEFLAFGANRLNRVVQRGELDVAFDLDRIVGARVAGGFGTKIIAVDLTDGSQFEFRCTGAKQVLRTLLDALPGT